MCFSESTNILLFIQFFFETPTGICTCIWYLYYWIRKYIYMYRNFYDMKLQDILHYAVIRLKYHGKKYIYCRVWLFCFVMRQYIFLIARSTRKWRMSSSGYHYATYRFYPGRIFLQCIVACELPVDIIRANENDDHYLCNFFICFYILIVKYMILPLSKQCNWLSSVKYMY